MAVKPA